MIVTGGRVLPLSKRIEMQEHDVLRIFGYYEDYKAKVYEEFAHQYISQILTVRIIRSWNRAAYMVISQTGTGKSTLIVEKVSEVVCERDSLLLLIVPRKALALQYKREFGERFCPQQLANLTDAGMDACSRWGPAEIYCFQQLTDLSLREKLLQRASEFDFLVIDEIHAFVGDAGFNPFTEDILRFLIQNFGARMRRLYLTATPDIVIDEIAMVEKDVPFREPVQLSRIGLRMEEVWMTVYRFKADFNYVKPVFFEKTEEVVEELTQMPAEEKVLIFVRSKAQGISLREKLGAERAVYIDATRKLNEEVETFTEILTKNSFSAQFLITTRFLDVGVNLKDVKIRSVLLFTYYKEDVLQMLGRRRVEQTDNIRLLVRVPSYTEIITELEQLERLDEEMLRNRNRFADVERICEAQFPNPFYVRFKNGRITVGENRFFHNLIVHHKDQIEKFSYKGNGREFYDNFISTVLSWLPGHQHPEILNGDDAVAPFKEEIVRLLKPYVGRELARHELVPIINDMLIILKIPRRKDQEDQLALSIIKREFNEKGIKFYIANLSKLGKKGVYIIKEGEWR